MATWYKLDYSNDILPVEVERETSECVFIRGKRRAKHGVYESFHESREKAVAFALKKQQDKVNGARGRLQYEEGKLDALVKKLAQEP